MMDIDEKTKCFRDAFEIARKGRSLTKKHDEVFKKLRGFLDDDVVDKIASFKPGNKGILLVGGDFDLLSGTVSYIWYRHKLQYLMSGDKIIKEGNMRLARQCLIYNDCGYNNEEEIRRSLFSQPDGLINKHKFATVLFLRDLDTKFTQILQRISRSVQDFKGYRKLETNQILFAVYGDMKKFFWRVYDPSIVVMNVIRIKKLPGKISQNFELIKLGSEKTKTVQAKTETNVAWQKGGVLRKGKAYSVPGREDFKVLEDTYISCETENTALIKSGKKKKWSQQQIAKEVQRVIKETYGVELSPIYYERLISQNKKTWLQKIKKKKKRK